MSTLFTALDQLDEKEGVSTSPWQAEIESGRSGHLNTDLPREILNDFYDLREYIRIANMRGLMRVLSITSPVSGEGTSTVSSYLSLLLAGSPQKAKTSEPPTGRTIEPAAEVEEGEKIFEKDFRAFIQDMAEEEPAAAEEAEPVAEAKQAKVLLLDANLHSPTLHERMSLALDGGLADILEGRGEWSSYVKPIRDTNLVVITAGRSEQNPSELLSSEVFRNFIKAVKNEFAYVIIDTPAVMNYVDSLSITSVVDGVVLVVRAGQTRWDVAQNAKRKLLMAHANLIGVALNRSRLTFSNN
jgi:capsular exopolysaccharide synthesis family protein